MTYQKLPFLVSVQKLLGGNFYVIARFAYAMQYHSAVMSSIHALYTADNEKRAFLFQKFTTEYVINASQITDKLHKKTYELTLM